MAEDDDVQPPIPQQPAQPTREQAQAELAQIDAWLQDFARRQQEHGQVTLRAAYLQGLLAQPTPSANRQQRRAKPKKAPVKRATPRSR